MGTRYTAKQGDYLAKIAREQGFSDYKTIWDDPQNAKLKEQRKNPNVLYPGDLLYIPDRQTKEQMGSTEAKHHFQVKQGRMMLRLVLEDLYGKPLADAKCELTVEGKTSKLVADSAGKIETEILPTAERAELIVKDGTTPLKDQRLILQIGHLDPIEELSGQRARLSNLGYFLGSIDQGDTEGFKSAVEEFQCDFGLAVDGICGPKTQAKLKQVHGC